MHRRSFTHTLLHILTMLTILSLPLGAAAARPPATASRAALAAPASDTSAAADLAISITDTPDPVEFGASLTYTLNVSNAGPDTITVGERYTNTTTIQIPTSGTAAPYPSSITVAGWTGSVSNVRVTLPQMSHTYPDDIDVLLVGPLGQTVLLMSDIGDDTSLVSTTLIFDDAGPALPDSSAITAGIYRPTNSDTTTDTFPSPAPASPYGNALSAYAGLDPNGTWSLYVRDDEAGDFGQIAGWSLTLLTADSDVVVRTTLPAGVSFVSASGSGWECYRSSSTVNCLRSSIPAGNLPPIALTVLVTSSTVPITTTATISGGSDPDLSNNTATTETAVSHIHNLAIATTASPEVAQAGARLIYTLTVTNLQPQASNPIDIIDSLPAEVTLIDAYGSGWTCTETASVTCSRPSLAANTASTITVAVRAPLVPTTLSNTAVVTTSWPDADPSNNTATLTTTVVPRDQTFIDLISPPYGGQASDSAPSSISGSAADPDGIQQVTVLIDNSVFEVMPFNGSITAVEWATSQSWAPSAPGSYTIAAVLEDANGSLITDTIEVHWDETTAPGGVAANLNLWLKADRGLTLSNGVSVTGWLDQSGHKYHVSQSNSADQPRYQAAAINGNSVVAFDKTDWLNRTIQGSALFDPRQATVLFAKQSVSGGVWFKWESTPSNRVGFELNSGATRFDMANDSSGKLNGITPVTDTFHLVSGLKSATNQFIYVDGREDVTRSNTSALITTPIVNLAIGKNYNGGLEWNGTFGEVIVFGRPLSTSERTQVESYLALKYGTTLLTTASTGMSYLDSSGATLWDAVGKSAYHHDVAGIGRDDASGLLQLQSQSINSASIVQITNGNSSATPAPIATDRSFLVWGSDNAAPTTAIMGSLGGGTYSRMARVWQVQETGSITATSLSFNLSGLGLAVNPAAVALLVSADPSFGSATVHSAGRSINGDTITFSQVDLASGAYFSLLLDGQAALDVTIDQPGSGTVSSTSGGIDCGSDCTELYPYGSVITLTATAAPTATFAGWSGACSGTADCSITIDESNSVTATFTLVNYSLSVAKTGNGAGTVSSVPGGIDCGSDCTEEYSSGSVITLTATATSGSSFAGWGGACSGVAGPICMVTVTEAQSVSAEFTRQMLYLPLVFR